MNTAPKLSATQRKRLLREAKRSGRNRVHGTPPATFDLLMRRRAQAEGPTAVAPAQDPTPQGEEE